MEIFALYFTLHFGIFFNFSKFIFQLLTKHFGMRTTISMIQNLIRL